jgi:hypothetical protein
VLVSYQRAGPGVAEGGGCGRSAGRTQERHPLEPGDGKALSTISTELQDTNSKGELLVLSDRILLVQQYH